MQGCFDMVLLVNANPIRVPYYTIPQEEGSGRPRCAFEFLAECGLFSFDDMRFGAGDCDIVDVEDDDAGRESLWPCCCLP